MHAYAQAAGQRGVRSAAEHQCVGRAGGAGGAGRHLHQGRRAGGAADADHAQVREPLPRRLQVLQQAQADGGDRLRAPLPSLHTTSLHPTVCIVS